MNYYYSQGACSMAGHIALCEAGAEFNLEPVSLKTHTTAGGQDFYEINPKGYVPAVELDEGGVLTENIAVLQYIADLFPTSNLAPENGTLERVRLQEWLSYISTEIHHGFSPFFSPALTPEIEKAFQFKAKLTKRLKFVEDTLAKRKNPEFLLGSDFTVADAYLYVMLTWCSADSVTLDNFPKLSEFKHRVADRPAVKAAEKAEAETAERLKRAS